MKWLLCTVALVGCAGVSTPEKGLAAAYAAMATTCDLLEKQIIEREPSTEEADRAAIADIRQRCDILFSAFDGVYTLVKAQP